MICIFKGVLTGSVYRDIDLMKNDFPGENHTSTNVLVIKTHLITHTKKIKDGIKISGYINY